MAGLAAVLVIAAGAGRAAAQTAPVAPLAAPQAPARPLALVIALPDAAGAAQAFQDARTVAAAARRAGFEVRRLESPAILPDPPRDPPALTLIYLAGGGGPPEAAPEALARRWTGAGGAVAVLAEDCPGARAAVPPPAAAPAGAMIVQSPRPDGACPSIRLTDTLMATLARPGADLTQALAQAGHAPVTGPGWTAPRLPEAVAAAEAERVIPAAGVPLRAVAGRQGVTFGGDRSARPTPPGFPEPSVIVGDPAVPPEPLEPAADPAPDAPVPTALAGEGFGTGAEDRLRLRATDPGLFASLMESGAFDPAPEEMVAAIQAELARMECYRGTVDGDWGAGSRAALARWAAAGGGQGSEVPDAALFRRIAAGPDLRCPVPVAAPATPRAAASPQPERRAAPQAQPAAPRRTPAAQPPRAAQPQVRQPAPQQPTRRIDPNALGTGVFR